MSIPWTRFFRKGGIAILAVCWTAGYPSAQKTAPDGPVAMTAPVYPSALRPGFEAVVHCLIVVDAQGRVSGISDMVGVTKTGEGARAGVPTEFRRAVEKAVRQWRYPAWNEPREMAVTFQFLLRSDEQMSGTARFVAPNFVQVCARRLVRDARQ